MATYIVQKGGSQRLFDGDKREEKNISLGAAKSAKEGTEKSGLKGLGKAIGREASCDPGWESERGKKKAKNTSVAVSQEARGDSQFAGTQTA